MSHHILKNYKIILAGLFFLLTSCTGFFEKDNTPAPTSLRNYRREVAPRLLWSTNVGKGSGKYDYLKMSPAVTDTALYAASTNGDVTSINKLTGRKIWQAHLKTNITSGPAVGDHLVVVGCRNGYLFGLQKSDGKLLWKKTVSGEIIAAPAIQNNVVVVKTIDGDTRGLSAQNGNELWTFQQTEPTLILRGSSAPLIQDNRVIAGYANGSLVKLNLDNGELLWQQTIAIAQGAFAIQRMVDIDADPMVFNHTVYAATYQGRIASLDWTTGRTLWAHDISSYTGMTADQEAVYISDARGLIRSFNAVSGEMNWRQDNLQYRIISGPASIGQYVIVGDGQGYLHWLNKSDGHIAGRASLDSPIYASPIADHHILYVLTNSGYLAAYTF